MCARRRAAHAVVRLGHGMRGTWSPQLNVHGQRVAIHGADGNVSTFAFDADNRVTATVSPSSGTALTDYDADGNATETIAANGSSIVTSYDADDRMTQAVWYESGVTVDTQAKSYDSDGRLLTAGNVNGTYSFSYDADGRVTQVSEPYGVTLQYAYDGDANQTQVVDSFGGTQTSVYDLEDRLATRKYAGQGQDLRVDFTYTANNQIASETDYDNLAGTSVVGSTTYAYDADENVTSIVSYQSGGTVIESFDYAYDRAGNVSSETDTQAGTPTTTSYSYDDANQLLSGGTASYSYDANGNRTMTGYTTGAGNELTSDGIYDYGYDASGNETTTTDIATDYQWTYGYNSGGELVSAEEQAGSGAVVQQITYDYDVFGQLIETEAVVGSTTTTTRYGVDGWNPAKLDATGTSNFDVWAVFNATGSLITRQLQGDGIDQHLGYVVPNGTGGGIAYWYLTDHLGSTRSVIDNSGTVQDDAGLRRLRQLHAPDPESHDRSSLYLHGPRGRCRDGVAIQPRPLVRCSDRTVADARPAGVRCGGLESVPVRQQRADGCNRSQWHAGTYAPDPRNPKASLGRGIPTW